jgi:hypothetical protein
VRLQIGPPCMTPSNFARSGDTLIVWKLDRLARSMKQLIESIENLRVRGIGFRSLTEALDTTTAQGRLVFHMFGALAEFERSLIRERTQAGLAAARRLGRKGGRPPKLTQDDLEAARALLANPESASPKSRIALECPPRPFIATFLRLEPPMLPALDTIKWENSLTARDQREYDPAKAASFLCHLPIPNAKGDLVMDEIIHDAAARFRRCRPTRPEVGQHAQRRRWLVRSACKIPATGEVCVGVRKPARLSVWVPCSQIHRRREVEKPNERASRRTFTNVTSGQSRLSR